MEKLTILSISKSEIKQVIKDRIEDETSPVFVDTDSDFAENIYYGDLFSTLSHEDLDENELNHLINLENVTEDCQYILITE